LENDQNFTDEFHGNTGPIIAHRFARDTWLPSQVAFYEACRAAGFPIVLTITIRNPLESALPHSTIPKGFAIVLPLVI
jgi:hypothetical protein